MPLSAFAVMTVAILLLSLILVLWGATLIASWIRAGKKVRQIRRESVARREIKLRALRLKEEHAREADRNDDYFKKWEEFTDGLPNHRPQDR
jgi:hypothetical protein